MQNDSVDLVAYRSMSGERRRAERERQAAIAEAARAAGRGMWVAEAFMLARTHFPSAVRVLWWMKYDLDEVKGCEVWRLLDADGDVIFDDNAGYNQSFAEVAYEVNRCLASAFGLADGVASFDDWEDGNFVEDFPHEDAHVIESRFV